MPLTQSDARLASGNLGTQLTTALKSRFNSVNSVNVQGVRQPGGTDGTFEILVRVQHTPGDRSKDTAIADQTHALMKGFYPDLNPTIRVVG